MAIFTDNYWGENGKRQTLVIFAALFYTTIPVRRKIRRFRVLIVSRQAMNYAKEE
jgi:hypothetical protein